MAVSNTPVVIVGSSPSYYVDFPNARSISVGTGLSFADNGPEGTYVLSAGGTLTSLATQGTSGYQSYNNSTNEYTSRSIAGSTGISITNGDGTGGNTVISQIPNSTLQRINVANSAGSVVGQYSQVKFVAGSGIDLTVVDSGAGDQAVVTVSQSSGTAGTVTSVNVDSITGLVVTGGPITTSGTIEIDLPGSGAAGLVERGDILVGDPGSYTVLPIGAAGKVLTSSGLTATWETPQFVTSVALDSDTGLIIDGSPITDDGTLVVNLPGSGTANAVERGDLLIGLNGGVYDALPIGTADQVLTSNGSTASWVDAVGGGTVTSVALTSATGVLVPSPAVTDSGTLAVDLPGSGASSTIQAGDLLYGDAAGGFYSVLGAGNEGDILKMVGGIPTWQPPI